MLLNNCRLSSLIAKSEEILLRWRQNKGVERWYRENGIEPFKRILREMPSDQALEELLNEKIEDIKYEDEQLQKVYNEQFWLYQIAAMKALREEAQRILALHNSHMMS